MQCWEIRIQRANVLNKSHLLCNRRAQIKLSDKYETDVLTLNDCIDLLNKFTYPIVYIIESKSMKIQ